MPRRTTLGVLAALTVAAPAAIVLTAGLSQAAAAPVAAPAATGRAWSSTADGFAQGTTGGAGGTTVTVRDYDSLYAYATASAAHVIRVDGTITIPTFGREIPVASHKTLIGVGRNGVIRNGGFFLGAGVSNVIIRNLTIGETDVASDDPDDKDFDYDGIQMDTANRVWIDHNTIKNVNDGAIDSRKDTTNVTISWNHLPGHNKTIGIGWTENVTARITIHHNWIQNTNQRNPSADNLQYAHLYNNYLQNVTSYGNYARGATRMVLENSYFQNVANPYYPDATAQLRQSGSICVSCTGRRETSGAAFTPGSFYAYTLDPAADVPALVRQYGGPQADIGR
jgi:pectate lyase